MDDFLARRLWLQHRTVEAHVGNIMTKLGLADDEETHRRVQAVLTFLGQRDGDAVTRRP